MRLKTEPLPPAVRAGGLAAVLDVGEARAAALLLAGDLSSALCIAVYAPSSTAGAARVRKRPIRAGGGGVKGQLARLGRACTVCCSRAADVRATRRSPA